MYLVIQLFRERLSENLCMRQSRKVIRDMINALFLTLWLSNLLLLLSFSTRKHTSMASLATLSNFFEKQWTQYLSGLSRALFPTTFLEIAVYSIVSRIYAALFLKRGQYIEGGARKARKQARTSGSVCLWLAPRIKCFQHITLDRQWNAYLYMSTLYVQAACLRIIK